jgi:hypothetical protein
MAHLTLFPPSLTPRGQIFHDRRPQMLIEPIRDGIGESHVLRCALHNTQDPALVARCLHQAVDNTGRPEKDVQHRIRIQEQHLFDLTLNIAILTSLLAATIVIRSVSLYDRQARGK